MRHLQHRALGAAFVAASGLGLVATQPIALFAQAASVTLLDYHSTVPAGWATRTPGSTMRLAEYVTPAAEGASPAEVVVYFFGKSQGGSVETNTARWKAQFSNPDGSPVIEAVTRDSTGPFHIAVAEYRGTYARGIGAGSSPEQAKPGQMLIAAIVETPKGTIYPQLFGPIASVTAQREAFLRFVRGIKE